MEFEPTPLESARTAARGALHELVDELPGEDLADALDYVRWLLADEDTLMPEELFRAGDGDNQIRRGEFITLDDFRQELGV